MSKETMQWLNTMTLHGFGRKPWHYSDDEQGAESNIYPEAIPVADILRRLFPWSAVSLPVFVAVPATFETMTGLSEAGDPIRLIALGDRQAIGANDRFDTFEAADVFGMFKSGYQSHQFAEWLLDKVSTFQLPVGSAGLLRNRGQAWVSFETADTSFQSGVEFYPRLLATTAHDGTTATTYKLVFTLTVCDNTREAALAESGTALKIRHSKYSHLRESDLSDTLGLMQQASADFASEIEVLTNMAVSGAQWKEIVARLVPENADSKRGSSIATAKRDRLDRLYAYDTRVQPWAGTAFGVLQAVNTWELHDKPLRSTTIRADRNMVGALSGAIGDYDRQVMATITDVLQPA